MGKATLLVTVPRIDRKGESFRKRGLDVVTLTAGTRYSHLSASQLRTMATEAVVVAGLASACRQVDIYIRGELVDSLRPVRLRSNGLRLHSPSDSMIASDADYSRSLSSVG